jgi:hypothetical protein
MCEQVVLCKSFAIDFNAVCFVDWKDVNQSYTMITCTNSKPQLQVMCWQQPNICSCVLQLPGCCLGAWHSLLPVQLPGAPVEKVVQQVGHEPAGRQGSSLKLTARSPTQPRKAAGSALQAITTVM